MKADPEHEGGRPPRLVRFFSRLLIHGNDARYILSDLDVSFARDIVRGLGRGRATRRYIANAFRSALSVWVGGLRGLVAHGVGLDAKLGLRLLAKQPLITAAAMLALGLGIPASLTLAHVVDAIYGEFPIPDGDRVLGIRHYNLDTRRPLLSSIHDYDSWTELRSLQSVGAVRSSSVNLDAGQPGASPVSAAEITTSGLAILGAQPLLGRIFDTTDELPGSPDVVLLGEDLWNARYGGDRAIVGQTLMIGQTPHTVVGVMPADFRFPLSSEVWLPFRFEATAYPPGSGPRLFVFGRLADSVSTSTAQAELTLLTEQRETADPEAFRYLAPEMVGMPLLILNEADDPRSDPRMAIVQTAMFALLMVVCGNVGVLIMARTVARSTETTIRAALGANRIRILTQLFVEGLILTGTATALGLLGANALVGWLTRQGVLDDLLPYWADPSLTPGIVIVAFGLAGFCALLAGVVPGLSATRSAIQPSLQRGGGRGRTVRFGVGSSLLIVGEIALSVAVLALGIAWMRSALLYQGRDLGFEPSGFVVATLSLPVPDELEFSNASDSLTWRGRLADVQEDLLTGLLQDPSVIGVSMGADVPGLSPPARGVILETPPMDPPAGWDVTVPRVHTSFFSGLNRPILAGRDFNEGDIDAVAEAARRSVIANESFVRDFLGGRSAAGQRLRFERPGIPGADLGEDEWYEIVGVVGSFGTNPMNSARDAAVYYPLAAGETNPIRYTIEVSGDPEAFLPRLSQISASVDAEATVASELLTTSMRARMVTTRTLFLVQLAIAGAAFLLSATGLYALLSFTISQRTREIGIRAALGARAVDIVSNLARRATIQVATGLALGVLLGWVLLDGESNDIALTIGSIPLTLALTSGVAMGVCVLACAFPIVRGLRVQPTEALQEF